jgi:hypothetical protein
MWLFMEFGGEDRYRFATDEHSFVSNPHAYYPAALGHLMAE